MGAFYSRNESFSRSYNAEMAEREFRFPKSRCWIEVRNYAKSIGKSNRKYLKILKATVDRIIANGTSEWHHVGKFANMVDYYDMKPIVDIISPKTESQRNRPHARTKSEWVRLQAHKKGIK